MNLRGLEYGAGGRNRTGTGLTPRDFESRASTNFTTPAIGLCEASNYDTFYGTLLA